jgi:hypothetical protein
VKRNLLRFSSRIIPGLPENRKRHCPEEEAPPDGTGWKNSVSACFLSPENSEKYFCFPYNFGLTKQGAEGILIRP